MRVNDSLRCLGVPRGTYYRWKKERAWEREKAAPVSPVQAFEALPEEKQAVIKYALAHPEVRHRELSWRMIDEDVAYLSASTVYRILRAEELMHRQRGRVKRYREEIEKASFPDEIWATDLMYLTVAGVQYYLITVIDEYSRYIVHWEIREQMTEADVELVLQRARERFPQARPRIISDNGPQFIARDFKHFIRLCGMQHVRTSPYYPQSHGKIERWHQTLKRECIRPGTPLTLNNARRLVATFVDQYNNRRLHSAIGYITPADKLTGREEIIFAQRREKLAQARQKRNQFWQGQTAVPAH